MEVAQHINGYIEQLERQPAEDQLRMVTLQSKLSECRRRIAITESRYKRLAEEIKRADKDSSCMSCTDTAKLVEFEASINTEEGWERAKQEVVSEALLEYLDHFDSIDEAVEDLRAAHALLVAPKKSNETDIRS
jgi:chromosome segregation ATPase